MIQIEKDEKQKKITAIFFFALLLCLQLAVCFYFGNRKAGFHEDELYSFYSTNKSAGLFINDREWIEKDQYRNEFVVLPEEAFRYGLVAQMQSWDVHPPLYYFFLHTACSLFPDIFSKWLGIGVNLIAFVINFFLLNYLTGKVWGSTGAGEKRVDSRPVIWLVCAVWGFAPAVISGVMFIRMYEWLTVFILLCACIHARAVEKGEMRLTSFYLPLAITVYTGFLTQYYYLIFHIFMGTGFCIWLFFRFAADRKKGLFYCLKYGVACAVGLGVAILSYPASMAHIFRGYRGTEAVSEFSDLTNTWERLSFFFGLLNDYLFGGALPGLLLVIAVLLIVKRLSDKKSEWIRKADCVHDDNKSFFNNNVIYMMLSFACMGYFFTISKTALLLGVTSNRYQLPIYGVLVILIVVPLFRITQQKAAGRWPGKIIPAVCVLAVMILNGKGLYVEDKVFFLYEEEAGSMAYARENAHSDVIVFYNETSPSNVWRLSYELMEYDRVYFVSEGNRDPVADPVIQNSDKILVYAADHDDAEQYGKIVFEANSKVSEQVLISKKELWTLYEFR